MHVFSSHILDVVIGVIFGFLAVSLVTSVLVETINSLLKLRSRSLLSGIKQLVNDPNFQGLAKDLYKHASINPRGSTASPTSNWPAYVDSKQFANALLDVTGLSEQAAKAIQSGGDTWNALQKAVNDLPDGKADGQMKTALTGMLNRAKGDLDELNKEICQWFDTSMDRVSGAFKRWTQLASFLIAVGIAVLLNVDRIRVAQSMWEQPAVADRLKLPTGVKPGDDGSAEAVLTFMDQHLPVGWPNGQVFGCTRPGAGTNPCSFWDGAWHRSIAGWLITALSTLFGAAFWFDALQSVTRLKGSGPSPKEKAEDRAAAA